MGEYEPNDSRNVTLKDGHAPGEPPRTGPREGEARQGKSELESDERGVDGEEEPSLRERAMERDTEELNEAQGERSPGR